MKPTKSYKEVLLTSLKDPAEYLNAALEEDDVQVFQIALQNAAEANGLNFGHAGRSPVEPLFTFRASLKALDLRFVTTVK